MTKDQTRTDFGAARRLCFSATALAAVLAAAPQPAFAQPAPADESGVQVDDIIVTARRREERLQSVPVSVAAFSGQALEDRSVQNISDLSGATPNFFVSSGPSGGGSTGAFYLRGVGQTDFIATTDPGVGLYVDGVYLSRSIGAVLDLADIERLEVLRGPQGTLFGRNAIGGAINITTRIPTDEAGGEVSASTGDYGRVEIGVRAEGPLVPGVLAGSLSLLRKVRDGYGERILTGEEMGNQDLWAARAILNFTPTERFSIVAALDTTQRDEFATVHSATDIVEDDANFPVLQTYNTLIATPGGTPYLNISPTCDPGLLPPAPQPTSTSCTSPFIGGNPFRTSGTAANVGDLETWGGSVTATYDLGAVTLKSITAYRSQESTSGVDYDNSPFSIADQIVTIETDTFSQELQLLGESFDQRLNWIIGAYYSDETSDTDFVFNALQPGIGPIVNIDQTLNVTSFALFASASWSITDRLSATAGIRYSRDEKRVTDTADFVTNPFLLGAPSSIYASSLPGPIPGVPNFLPAGSVVSDERDWDDLSPRLSLEYQASESMFFYGSVARGYKSGSFNGRPLTGAITPTAYEPETVTTYEVGAKLDLFDRRLRINGSLFRTDYEDIQVTVVVVDGPLVNTPTVNAGEAELTGFELEMQAALSEAFSIDASVGWLDAQFTSLSAPSSFPGAVIPFTTSATFAQTPEWTASLGAQYRFDLGGAGQLTLRADANYRDEVYFNVPNIEAASQGAFTLINARATYETRDGNWSAAIFGANLTDEDYKTFGFVAFGVASTYWGQPRMWGVTLKRRF